jgi:phytoene dehydrogenase-like protein
MMHDVVFIGGGHNGLVCSAYLAMAGLKVLVLDQRPVAGGAAVTEEFSPGFRNSVASYAVSLLTQKSFATSISAPMDCGSSSARCLTSCLWAPEAF